MLSQEIANIEEEIVEEFELLEEPMVQYEYIIDLGKKLPDLDDIHKKEANIVKGCQSTVWLHADYENGKVVFEADSNTVITKGIIALLMRVLSNRTPEEIINAQLGFIDKIHLRTHLSVQRSNGLNAMIKRMKYHAVGFGGLDLN